MAAPTFFTPFADDRSVYYLGQIFGNVGNVLVSTTPSTMLGTLFGVLNTIALSVGAIIIVYTTVVGLLATAQEGEFLGKKWAKLWVPVRMVLGIASLFPSASGYSMIQVVFMWIIMQGIGAADTLWKSAIDRVTVIGSPFGGIAPSSVGVSPALTSVFQGLVCQQTAAVTSNNDSASVKYYSKNNTPYTVGDFDTNKTTYSMGPYGNCGTLTMCDKAQACPPGKDQTVACWACTGQHQVMASVVHFLDDVAKVVVDTDTQYVAFYNNYGAPADWIKEYCKTGLGISDEKNCCVKSTDPKVTCTQFPTSYEPNSPNGANVGQDALKVYEQYSIYPTLSGGKAPVTTVDSTADFIGAATNMYIGGVSAYVNGQIQNLPTQTTKDWKSDAIQYGWITAGSYYYHIAKATQNNIEGINPKLEVSDASKSPSGNVANYRNNYNGLSDLLSAITNAGNNSGTGYSAASPPSGMEMIYGSIGRASSEIVRGFIANLSGEGTGGAIPGGPNTTDAFQNVIKFGLNLLMTAQLLFAVVIVLAAGISIGLALTGGWIVLGTGQAGAPLLEAIKAALGMFTPVFFALLGALFVYGALLGIYIPMIPYVVFSITAIGWLIATIESMAAAPIVALGILSPGGQHELLGKAEQAMFIMLNLFLRPTLMVVGLLAAMLLANVAIKLINFGFIQVMGDIVAHPGMVEQFIFIAVYISLVFIAMNKVFSLIHLIPERVLTYIGGHAIQYGEGEAAGQMKHGVEAAGAGAAAGMKGGAEGASGVGSVPTQYKKHQDAVGEANKINIKNQNS